MTKFLHPLTTPRALVAFRATYQVMDARKTPGLGGTTTKHGDTQPGCSGKVLSEVPGGLATAYTLLGWTESKEAMQKAKSRHPCWQFKTQLLAAKEVFICSRRTRDHHTNNLFGVKRKIQSELIHCQPAPWGSLPAPVHATTSV